MTIVLDARTATDHFPGIGRYVVNLAHALKAIAPDLDLTLLCDPNARSARLTLPNLPVTHLPLSPFSLQQQWRVPRRLRSLKARLYHSPYYLMPYRPGVPTVVTAYDVIPLIHPQYYTVSQRLIFRLAHDLALRTARTILAISEATRRDLIRRLGVPAGKIVVTPLAADPCFKPQTADRMAAARAAYHLPDHYVLYVGSNKPHKNLVRLVTAFSKSEVRSQKSEVHLVIAGAWDNRYPEAKHWPPTTIAFTFLTGARGRSARALRRRSGLCVRLGIRGLWPAAAGSDGVRHARDRRQHLACRR